MNLNELYKRLREEDFGLDFNNKHFKLGVLAIYIDLTGLNDLYLEKQKTLFLDNVFKTETEEVEVKQEIGFLKEAFKGEETVKFGGMFEAGYLMALGALSFYRENEVKKSRSFCFNCRKSDVEYTVEEVLAKRDYKANEQKQLKKDVCFHFVAKEAYCKECNSRISLSNGFSDPNIHLANSKIRIILNILTAPEVRRIIDYVGADKVAKELDISKEWVDKFYNGSMLSKETSDKLAGLLKVAEYRKD